MIKSINLFFAITLPTVFAFAQQDMIIGVVLDKVSKDPVENVTVSFIGTAESFITTSDGGFNLRLGSHYSLGKPITLSVYHETYGWAEHEITLRTNDRTNPYKILIDGTRNVIVTGTVKDKKTQNAIKGLDVTLTSNKSRVPLPTKKTDAFGRFRIEFSKGALSEITEYMNLQIADPKNVYGYYSNVVNITTALSVELEKSNGIRKSSKLDSRNDKPIRLSIPDVEEGNIITIDVEGNIGIGSWVGTTGPAGKDDGVGGISLAAYSVVPEYSHAAVLYRRVGETTWKVAGEGVQFIAEKTGTLNLEFIINDKKLEDNSGFFDIKIQVTR